VDRRHSPSYPGLPTVYTLHGVAATLPCLPAGAFTAEEPRPGGARLVTSWEWVGGDGNGSGSGRWSEGGGGWSGAPWNRASHCSSGSGRLVGDRRSVLQA